MPGHHCWFSTSGATSQGILTSQLIADVPLQPIRVERFCVHHRGNLLDVLLPVEGHEVERQLLELVGPEVVLLQVVLQPLQGELGQHDLGQAHVADFEAAPQRVDTLHAQVQGHLGDEGGLPAACGTWWARHSQNK